MRQSNETGFKPVRFVKRSFGQKKLYFVQLIIDRQAGKRAASSLLIFLLNFEVSVGNRRKEKQAEVEYIKEQKFEFVFVFPNISIVLTSQVLNQQPLERVQERV